MYRAFRAIVTWVLVFLVRAYQFAVSPLLVGGCRFVPSCSQYAAEALRRHGPWRGTWLAVRRVLRCRPGQPGGYDPVP
jgi:putative membrane protein insertion efficiency factor